MSTLAKIVTAPMEECWRRIGVSGDRSCPELQTFIHCRNCPVLAEAARTFFDREAPEGYLESWSQILAEPGAAVTTDAVSVLIFRIGKEWLAIPTTTLVEISPLRPLHRVPHRTAGVLEGLVNIRGQLQLCVSLHGLLGLEDAPPAWQSDEATSNAARLLVVERATGSAAGRWVFGADEVAGVQRIERDGLRRVPSTVSQSATHVCQALFDWQNRAVGLLDESRLFGGLQDRISR